MKVQRSFGGEWSNVNANHHLIFQVLTKRSERLAELRAEFT